MMRTTIIPLRKLLDWDVINDHEGMQDGTTKVNDKISYKEDSFNVKL